MQAGRVRFSSTTPGLAGLLALALCAVEPVRADIYHYTDGDGVGHYTNVPPVSGGWRRLRLLDNDRDPPCAKAPSPDSKRFARYDEHIREAAQLYQLPEAFIRAVIQVL